MLERGIQDAFAAFVAATTKEYASIEKRRQDLWRDLMKKYSLDIAKQHTIKSGPTGAFLEETSIEMGEDLPPVPMRPA